MWMIPTKWLFDRLSTALPYLLVAAVLLGGYVWQARHHYARGEAAGRTEVQALWDADRAMQQAVTAELRAQAKAREEADRKAALEVQNALQTKLADADARARDLARRLSAAYAAASRERSLPGPADAPAGADSPTGEPGGDGSLAAATADVMAACARDAERLDGWQDWWGRVSMP